MHFKSLILSAFLTQFSIAAPVTENTNLTPTRTNHEARQLNLGSIVGPVVSSVLSGLVADATDGAAIVSAILEAAGDTLGNQIPSPPTDVAAAVSTLASVFAAVPTDLVTNILELIPAGFPVDDIGNLLSASIDPRNSGVNNNPPPQDVIYPKKDPRDAPYDLTEQQLRQVIYIPAGFTYGQKPPVILVPGTGNTGFQTFIGNYIPLLTGVSYADPVWLNIPGQLLGDAQTHAEYVAYAINYISSITGNQKNVNVLVWSQGSIDSQWAFKYWPSTRSVTQNLIANSPDYRGTVLAYAICPEFPRLPCEPAVLQQAADSNFIATLRNNGGDAAFVPTTNIYSATDEIVQPQSPLIAASGYLKQPTCLAVTNVLIQETCGGRGVGGTFYTHEGVLYSSLGVALALDALKNGRPGRLEDLDLDFVCAQYLGQGLNLLNLLTTEESILIAALSIVLYVPKVFAEPPIKAYANGAVVPACPNTSSSSATSSLTRTSTRTTASATVSLTTSTKITTRTSPTGSRTSHDHGGQPTRTSSSHEQITSVTAISSSHEHENQSTKTRTSQDHQSLSSPTSAFELCSGCSWTTKPTKSHDDAYGGWSSYFATAVPSISSEDGNGKGYGAESWPTKSASADYGSDGHGQDRFSSSSYHASATSVNGKSCHKRRNRV